MSNAPGLPPSPPGAGAAASAASGATDLSLKDAFDIYQKQSDSVHKLWTYFQVVSIAVLGYTIGSEKVAWSSWIYVFIGASYAVFAIANQWVLAMSQGELEQLSIVVNGAAAKASSSLKIEAVDKWKVRAFHTFSAVVVLVALVFTWQDKCSAQWLCPTSVDKAVQSK